jgi:hypothetical protein
MKAKPWQIAVIVIGLLVAAGFMTWSFVGSDSGDVPRYYFLVDVESGQIYRVDRNKYSGMLIPAINPETGKRSLIGLAKDDKGFYVTPRDVESIKGLEKDIKNNVVDAATGELKAEAKQPIEFRQK